MHITLGVPTLVFLFFTVVAVVSFVKLYILGPWKGFLLPYNDDLSMPWVIFWLAYLVYAIIFITICVYRWLHVAT